MKAKLAAVAVALLLVGTGAAVAAPGNAPTDAPAENDTAADGADTPAANETDGDADTNETDDADGQGPPTDMPDQVPDFVTGIHEAIGAHLDGNISGAELGDRIQSLTPGDDADEAESDDAEEAESDDADEEESDDADDDTQGPPSDSPAPAGAGQ